MFPIHPHPRTWAPLFLVLAGCAEPGGMAGGHPIAHAGGSAAAARPPFTEPATLENRAREPRTVEVDLVAAPHQATLVPGKQTGTYAYNGALPGPTLDATEGDRVVVHFTNRLAEPTNVHWHGLHIPSDQDGLPMDLVPPGGKRDYVFTIPAGTAGTYWYHPHGHGRTGGQIARGLAGAIRVRPAADPLPAGIPDTLVVLSDNRLTADGAIAPTTDADRMNGREGDLRFVNGRIFPTLPVRAGELRRLRLVNTSAARYHRLAIPGHALHLIATDGGFLAAPGPVPEVLLAPGERAEVLVRATGQPGSTAELVDLPYARGAMTPMPPAPGGGHGDHYRVQQAEAAGTPLMTLAYGQEPATSAPAIPNALRPVPTLPVAGATVRTVTFSENHTALDFRVNGQKFAPDRVDMRARLGTTEVWAIRNQGDMDHPFHLHGFSFQVLDRDGRPEPFRAWKDTVNVRKGEEVRIAVRFADFPGPRVFHCHIIEHEDLGMMGTLQVD